VREIECSGEVPGLLAEPYAGRKSGTLHFVRREERRSIRFRKGRIVYASTNIPPHHLGETLVRHGRLSPHGLAVASEALQKHGGMLGTALLNEGLLDRGQLVDALELHTRTVVEPLFAWRSGGYEFVSDDGAASPPHRPPDVLTVDLIAAAARRLDDEAILRAGIHEGRRPLVHGDLPANVRTFVLTEEEAAALRLVDGARTVPDILALRPDARTDTLRSLCALLWTGVVTWLPGAAGARAPEPRPSRRTPSDEQDAFARAETWVAIERYWDAIQILEPLVPRMSELALREASRILLARAYLNNPKWVRRAEELLQAVVADNPRSAEALFMLGQLYEAKGLRRRAEVMLRRVLDVRPGHRSAAAALQALVGPEPRRPRR
jgi:hypothetical protein